ncbi:MAG: hypothetical protein WCO56_08500 [Verrucomicrobiota bacterium]
MSTASAGRDMLRHANRRKAKIKPLIVLNSVPISQAVGGSLKVQSIVKIPLLFALRLARSAALRLLMVFANRAEVTSPGSPLSPFGSGGPAGMAAIYAASA